MLSEEDGIAGESNLLKLEHPEVAPALAEILRDPKLPSYARAR